MLNRTGMCCISSNSSLGLGGGSAAKFEMRPQRGANAHLAHVLRQGREATGGQAEDNVPSPASRNVTILSFFRNNPLLSSCASRGIAVKPAVLLFSLLVAGVVPAFAQSQPGTGALAGAVQDPSGARVPNAAVKVTSVGTGMVRDLSSGATGNSWRRSCSLVGMTFWFPSRVLPRLRKTAWW